MNSCGCEFHSLICMVDSKLWFLLMAKDCFTIVNSNEREHFLLPKRGDLWYYTDQRYTGFPTTLDIEKNHINFGLKMSELQNTNNLRYRCRLVHARVTLNTKASRYSLFRKNGIIT